MPAHAVAGKPLKHPRGSRPFRFLWTGSVATHPTDLQQAAAGFQKLVLHGPAECRIIGTGKGVASRLGLGPDEVLVTEPHPDDPEGSVQTVTRPNPLVHATGEWVPIDDYPTLIAKTGDAGVVPLDYTPFNEGKSWLKGLEFAAAGRPFVASATEPYTLLRDDHGIGLIAKRPRDWIRQMTKLEADPEYAEGIAAAWLDTVRQYMTYEANAHRWAAVWEEAFDIRCNDLVAPHFAEVAG
jgi:glycosyltransferase involved in cell wall biosynthesis